MIWLSREQQRRQVQCVYQFVFLRQKRFQISVIVLYDIVPAQKIRIADEGDKVCDA